MLKKEIKLKRSPFYKQRNMKAPRGSTNVQTQISQDMLEDFMKYARYYNAEHPPQNKPKDRNNKANPLKHIINEFLNTHALERKCFNDLYVIMACNPINFNEAKPNVDGEIIGFIEAPEKFTKFEPFRAVRAQNKSKSIYMIVDFNKETFDMMDLASFDREVLFGIEPHFYKEFDDLKLALTRTYKDIDFDNARICMFNLNNYFDILKNGVYVSEHSTYIHDGLVVLIDGNDIYMNNRLILRINWSYNAGVFTCKLDVEDVGFFNTKACNDLPVQVSKDYWSITSGFLSSKAKLEYNLKNANLRVLMAEQELEKAKREQLNAQREFDEFQEM